MNIVGLAVCVGVLLVVLVIMIAPLVIETRKREFELRQESQRQWVTPARVDDPEHQPLPPPSLSPSLLFDRADRARAERSMIAAAAMREFLRVEGLGTNSLDIDLQRVAEASFKMADRMMFVSTPFSQRYTTTNCVSQWVVSANQ